MSQLEDEKNKNVINLENVVKENENILMSKIEEIEYGARYIILDFH